MSLRNTTIVHVQFKEKMCKHTITPLKLMAKDIIPVAINIFKYVPLRKTENVNFNCEKNSPGGGMNTRVGDESGMKALVIVAIADMRATMRYTPDKPMPSIKKPDTRDVMIEHVISPTCWREHSSVSSSGCSFIF